MTSNPKPGPAKGTTPAAPPAETPATLKQGEQVVTTDDVAAIMGAPTVPAPEALEKRRQRIVVSQGAFDDLTRLRKITDAGSGFELRADDDGKVTAYKRGTNEPADVEIICPPVPAAPAKQA